VGLDTRYVIFIVLSYSEPCPYTAAALSQPELSLGRRRAPASSRLSRLHHRPPSRDDAVSCSSGAWPAGCPRSQLRRLVRRNCSRIAPSWASSSL